MTNQNAPVDRGAVALIIFLLGLDTLLPWNFFITATEYFEDRLKGPSASNGPVQVTNGTAPVTKNYNFASWMTLLSQLPLLLFTLANSFLYQLVKEKIRIAASMGAILFLFILTAIMVRVNVQPDSFFSITMATIWFINSFGAVLQGSLFGLVGLLPPKYSMLFMSGQGLAGIFASLASLLSILSEYQRPPVICPGSLQKGAPSCHPHHLHVKWESKPVSDSVWFGQIWVMALCVTCVMAVTLSVFPAITVQVRSVYGNAEWGRYFLCVCCFIVFNVMDLIGRSVTSVVQWPSKTSRLFPVLVVARVVFIPLIMLCNTSDRQYLPVLFSHDVAFVTIMTLFALSNGYFICLSMSYAPQLVRSKDCETAGALMTFFLALGLSLGAAFSFLLKSLL
uniref:Solute carrier family 29 member 2 n=1 Tax=Esox lucius TaxID=8010 RepID=A0AAY5KB19_ESOLU